MAALPSSSKPSRSQCPSGIRRSAEQRLQRVEEKRILCPQNMKTQTREKTGQELTQCFSSKLCDGDEQATNQQEKRKKKNGAKKNSQQGRATKSDNTKLSIPATIRTTPCEDDDGFRLESLMQMERTTVPCPCWHEQSSSQHHSSAEI